MIDLDIHGNTKPLEASVQAAINRIRRQPIKITVDDKGATQPLGNMKRGADEFSKSMEAANARIIAFGASMAIINGVSDAFKGMVKNMVEVEKALADINVVMGLSAKNLDKFSDSLFQVAKETGAAFNIAAQAATEYARQGLAVEESLKRTKDALILTRLTGMDSAEAVKSLTAAMNTYGSQIKDTTQLVSKFAAVDVQFAVSAEDFADAIARTGAAAKGAGVDIDELIGFVTAAQQQTARGGKVIGNSLKTIFTRVGRTDTLNQLEGLGIAVRDLEGKTLGAKRILTDLANTFDRLSESQKAQIAQTVGGVFQINVLKAVLGDAAKQNGILSTATQIAAGATDEAITKNEQLRQTMSAMATETGLAIKELSAQIGEIMLAPGMEKILNTVKSFAESASGILGDGESTGNKFATGFLKGLGNIITGPGLVVLTTVFVKLFAQAFKFTKDSLNSLVGITTQAQKQKAIQTSLVTLFGQNAALNKEMLRTDISRAEKEKIILGLIQAQVAQAKTLNEVSRQAASTLYQQGYGPSLTPRKRNRAYGHIPNFSERQQAAEGGYAAGNIRTMDMPGQGSVIYNSAEQVKNFAGFKQPAIMPPQSSKAGKNYQKAFGEVHGFDPYAADGFVPNFSRSQKGAKVTPSRTINAVPYAAMLVPQYVGQKISGGGTGVVTSKDSRGVLSRELMQRHKNLTAEQAKAEIDSLKFAFKVAGVKASGIKDLAQDEYGGIQGILESKIVDTTVQYADMIAPKSLKGTPVNRSRIKNRLTDGQSGAKGALGSVYGSIFEAALNEKLQLKSSQDVAQGPIAGGDFDVINPSKELLSIFGNLPSKNDYKASTTKDNAQSMAAKIAKEFINNGKIVPGVVGYKNTDRLKRYNKALSEKAEGHIPNFANPLADAISRERQAGVPVSQIRVDSHPALVNKSNPAGLGVTNTKDEPNGLRDVFGAKGFVPNYAIPGMISDVFTGLKGGKSYEAYEQELEEARTELDKQNKQVQKLTRQQQRYERASQSSTLSEDRKRLATQKATDAENRLTAAKQARADAERRATTANRNRIGAGARGNLGMTAILGAPMAAAYLQGGGPGQTGSGGQMYAAGGALQGAASTGYMASMIAPFFGPAAPFVIAAGALYGAFDGWTSAQKENTEAIKKQNAERVATQAQSYEQGLRSIIQAAEMKEPIKKLPNIQKSAKILGLSAEQTAGDALIKSFDVLAKRSGEVPHLDTLGHVPGVEKYQQYFQKQGKYYPPEERKRKLNARANKGAAKESRQKSIAMSREFDEFAMSAIGASKGQAQEAKKIRDELIDYFLENEEGNVFSFDFGSTNNMTKPRVVEDLTKEEYAKVLKGETITKKINNVDHELKASDEKIAGTVNPRLKKLKDEYDKQQAERLQGLIVEVDKEKAARTVRRQTFDAEMRIKKSALERSNLYLIETELQKKFLSETEVATKKYLNALEEAKDSFKSGQIASQAKTREDFVRLAARESDFRAALASNLNIQGEKMGDDATIADITEALASVDVNKLIDAAEKYQATLGDDDAAKSQRILVEAITEEYREANRQLKEDNNLKVRGIELEKQRNIVIGERNDLLEQSKMRVAEYNAEVEHRIAMMKFDRDIGESALRASGVYISEEMRGRKDIADSQIEMHETRKNYQAQRTTKALEMFAKYGIHEDQYNGSFIDAYMGSRDKEKEQMKSLSDERLQEVNQQISSLQDNKGEKTPEIEKQINALLEEQKTILEEIQEIENRKIELRDDDRQELIDAQKEIDRLIEKEEKHIEVIKTKGEERAKAEQNKTFSSGFKRGVAQMNDQVGKMNYELGVNIPQNFADGLAGALGEALNGAKDLNDALEDAALNFLQMLQQAFLQQAVRGIVGNIGNAMASKFNHGGSVRNYSRGGGVPAYVSNGEYVMNRQAVNKYGGSFMHNLNAGQIPKFNEGGQVDPRSAVAAIQSGAAPTGIGGLKDRGNLYQRMAVSGYFHSKSGNVALKEDSDLTIKEVREEERRRREAEARRQRKKARRKALFRAAAGAVIGAVFSGLASKGMESMAESGKLGETAMLNSWGTSAGVTPEQTAALKMMNPGMTTSEALGQAQWMQPGSLQMQDTFDYGSNFDIPDLSDDVFSNFQSVDTELASRGGMIRRYSFGGGPIKPFVGPIQEKNAGGWISGKSGIDQIPAMLSDGEYVIKASSARRLGKPMLDQINAGKFNEGGSVGPQEELFNTEDQKMSSGNTNNISVTVNVQGGSASEGSKEQSSDKKGGGSASEDEKNNAELAERVKHQVVAVIMEEQRPGGLLA